MQMIKIKGSNVMTMSFFPFVTISVFNGKFWIDNNGCVNTKMRVSRTVSIRNARLVFLEFWKYYGWATDSFKAVSRNPQTICKDNVKMKRYLLIPASLTVTKFFCFTCKRHRFEMCFKKTELKVVVFQHQGNQIE